MKPIFIAIFSLIFSIYTPISFAQAPENLHISKQQVIAYYNSGNYEKDLSSVATQAETYLQQRVNENAKSAQPKKLAIVFDIDETALSNYPDMLKLNFGGTMKMMLDDIAKGQDAAIKPTLQLYQLAEKDHVAVFFITGRYQWLQQATIKNLKAADYTKWNQLMMKPNNYQLPSVIPFKSSERAKIEKQGYDIVVNIGDQYSDLKGGYADKTFKLPDPYYFIP